MGKQEAVGDVPISRYQDSVRVTELRDLGFTVKSDDKKTKFVAIERQPKDRKSPQEFEAKTLAALVTKVKLELSREGGNGKAADKAEDLNETFEEVMKESGESAEKAAADAPEPVVAPDVLRENGRQPKVHKVDTKKKKPKDEYLFDEMKERPQKDLPGMRAIAKAYDDAKLARVEATALETATRNTLETFANANEEFFAVDPNTGIKSFTTEDDIVVELTPGPYKMTTRHAEEE